MKNFYKLLFIVCVIVFASCSSDDDGGCSTTYSGRIEKIGTEYFVYYYNNSNGGELESVQVPEEIYSWIMRGHLNNGDCFDVDKYRFVK